MCAQWKTRNTHRIVATLGMVGVLGLTAGGPAMASDEGQYREPEAAQAAVAPGQYLSLEQVVAHLKQQGYADIYEVEREHGAYEVKARNPQGQKVKLYVEPRTGEVLRHKLDD